MNKEVISEKQAIYLIALFIVAETFVLARGMEAKKDFWIAIIFGLLISAPLMLIFAKLHTLYPEKDLFDINEYVLGRVLGKMLNFLLIYYVATNMMSVMSVFNNFIITTTLIDTPMQVTYIAIILICIYSVKAGIEVLSRLTEFIFPIIITVLIIGTVILIPRMNIKNIQPVLSEGVKSVIEGGILTLLFPLSETIAFVMIFSGFKNGVSFKKIYLYGLTLGGSLMFILASTEVLVLGVNQTIVQYFPGYRTFTQLSIGELIQRLEVISGATFITGGFIKISVLLLAVSRGFSKIFNLDDYRLIVTPVGLFIANMSYIFYDSTIFMFKWIADYWGYFAAPFQIIIPIIVYIIVGIKVKMSNMVKQREL